MISTSPGRIFCTLPAQPCLRLERIVEPSGPKILLRGQPRTVENARLEHHRHTPPEPPAERRPDVAHVPRLLGDERAVGEILLVGRTVGVDGERHAHLSDREGEPAAQHPQPDIGVEHLDRTLVREVDLRLVGHRRQQIARKAEAGVPHLEAPLADFGLVFELAAHGPVDLHGKGAPGAPGRQRIGGPCRRAAGLFRDGRPGGPPPERHQTARPDSGGRGAEDRRKEKDDGMFQHSHIRFSGAADRGPPGPSGCRVQPAAKEANGYYNPAASVLHSGKRRPHSTAAQRIFSGKQAKEVRFRADFPYFLLFLPFGNTNPEKTLAP